MLKTLRQLKSPLPLTERLAYMLMYQKQMYSRPTHRVLWKRFWVHTLLTMEVNSEEMMAGSHITKFHTFEQEEPVTTELLNMESNVPDLTRKHDTGGGHHNQSNPQSARPTDYKLNTREDDSFSSNIVRKEDVAKVMGKTLNMVEGFINNMLPKSSCLQAPPIVKDNNKQLIEMKSETWILPL